MPPKHFSPPAASGVNKIPREFMLHGAKPRLPALVALNSNSNSKVTPVLRYGLGIGPICSPSMPPSSPLRARPTFWPTNAFPYGGAHAPYSRTAASSSAPSFHKLSTSFWECASLRQAPIIQTVMEALSGGRVRMEKLGQRGDGVWRPTRFTWVDFHVFLYGVRTHRSRGTPESGPRPPGLL